MNKALALLAALVVLASAGATTAKAADAVVWRRVFDDKSTGLRVLADDRRVRCHLQKQKAKKEACEAAVDLMVTMRIAEQTIAEVHLKAIDLEERGNAQLAATLRGMASEAEYNRMDALTTEMYRVFKARFSITEAQAR